MQSSNSAGDRPWVASYAEGVPAEIPAVTETLRDVSDRLLRADIHPLR